MGKKYKRKGEYFLFYRACILAIVLLTLGCGATWLHNGTWEAGKQPGEAERQLGEAEQLALKGDFKKALRKDREIANLFPHTPPGDRALFHMGLIFAHPDNPQHDYTEALKYFKKVVKNFPKSGLKFDSVSCIHAIRQVIYSYRKIKELQQRISSLETKVKDDTEAINILKEQLRKIKEIDIITEEKKRVRSPGD